MMLGVFVLLSVFFSAILYVIPRLLKRRSDKRQRLAPAGKTIPRTFADISETTLNNQCETLLTGKQLGIMTLLMWCTVIFMLLSVSLLVVAVLAGSYTSTFWFLLGALVMMWMFLASYMRPLNLLNNMLETFNSKQATK